MSEEYLEESEAIDPNRADRFASSTSELLEQESLEVESEALRDEPTESVACTDGEMQVDCAEDNEGFADSSNIGADSSDERGLIGALAGINEKLDALTFGLDGCAKQLDDLSGQFKSKISRSEYEDRTLKQYSDEIQQYRSDLYKKIMLPLLKEIMEFRSNLSSSIARAYAVRPDDPQMKVSSVETYRDMLDVVLMNYGVEIHAPEKGAPLTPGLERSVGKIKTGDKELHGTLAEVACDGYLMDEKCVMPARVKVFVFDESLQGVDVNNGAASSSVVPSEKQPEDGGSLGNEGDNPSDDFVPFPAFNPDELR